MEKLNKFELLSDKNKVYNIYGYADVAQMVEQRIRNAQVRGSSPLISSIYMTLAGVYILTLAGVILFSGQIKDQNIVAGLKMCVFG